MLIDIRDSDLARYINYARALGLGEIKEKILLGITISTLLKDDHNYKLHTSTLDNIFQRDCNDDTKQPN